MIYWQSSQPSQSLHKHRSKSYGDYHRRSIYYRVTTGSLRQLVLSSLTVYNKTFIIPVTRLKGSENVFDQLKPVLQTKIIFYICAPALRLIIQCGMLISVRKLKINHTAFLGETSCYVTGREARPKGDIIKCDALSPSRAFITFGISPLSPDLAEYLKLQCLSSAVL